MRLFAFLLVFFVGCVPRMPSRVLVIHADVQFTPEERKVIHDATESLMSQVLLRVDIIYDYEFGKPSESITLSRISREAEKTREMDKLFRGVTFGWTSAFPKVHAYLVSDVLIGGETLYTHVVMHEILHVLGCDHVEDPKAVLYGQTDLEHQAVKLTEADRTELIRTQPGGISR